MEHPRRRYADKVFDAIPGYLTVQDHDFFVVEANETFRRDFGDYEGRRCYQVYKQRSEKCDDCPVEKTFRDGQRHQAEESVGTLDGRVVPVLVYSTPVFDDSGNIIGAVKMSTDITELKHSQIQFRESRRRYQQLFEEVPCYISIQDRDLRIIEANRLFREAFGNNYGCKCYNIYKHRTEECYPCIVRQTYADGETHVHEEVVTDRDGRQMNVLVRTMPIKNINGEVESVIEMSTDITQIRTLQSKLTSIGLIISSISHGLKGLLNSLDGGVYLINSGLKKNDQVRVEQGWEIAQRNIGRIRSMILDILYYAKDREPDWQEISAGALLDEAYNLVELKARNHNITMVKNCGDKIDTFEGDPKALRTLLVNLLENSMDACRIDKNKETHAVDISLRSDDSHIEYVISDNGIGMDQETREKAFSLFFSSKGTEGTGLGLFISHKIAIQHGGNIKLESELNKGTRFIVTLPRKRPANAEKKSEV